MGADNERSTAACRFVIPMGQTITGGLEMNLRGEILCGLKRILNSALTDSRMFKFNGTAQKEYIMSGFAKHITNGWITYRISVRILKGLGFSI